MISPAQHAKPVGKQRTKSNIRKRLPLPGNAEIGGIIRHRLMHLTGIAFVQTNARIGMGRNKFGNHGGQNTRQNRWGCSNRNLAPDALGQRIKIAKRLFKIGQQPPGNRQEPLPGLRQRHLPCRAIKKGRPRHILELANGRGNRRHAQPQNPGRSRKIPLIGNCDKHTHMTDIKR